jgi:hypothetical protein
MRQSYGIEERKESEDVKIVTLIDMSGEKAVMHSTDNSFKGPIK